jgi:hypothetical protein
MMMMMMMMIIIRYPCNRPWRPIGLWYAEVPTFPRQSAQGWRWGCQPYAPAALYPHEDPWYSCLLEADCESTPGSQCGWKYYVNYLIGNWTRGPQACSIVPQPTTLSRTRMTIIIIIIIINKVTR